MKIFSTSAKLLCALLLSAFAHIASAQLQLLDQIAAVVDDDVVMLSELESRVTNVYARLTESGTEPPARHQLVAQVLERLILERLQLNMGLRAGVRVTDAELTESMARMSAAQGLTLDQLVEKAHQEGVKLSELRSQLRNDIIINRIQDARVNRRIRITEQDVNNFLKSEEGRNFTSDEVNLGHIMLPLPAGANREEIRETQQKAADIIAQLQNGAAFKKLALTHSAGQNALSGGDLGWRKTAQLPGIFAQAINALKPGDVTEPLRSDAGLHLLKLYERRGGDVEQMVMQSKVRHILIKPNEIRTDEDSRQMLLGMREDILAGVDFAVLAKEHSEDIGSALQGGDLGWSLPGQFVPKFEEVMNQIEVNDLSDPFRSQFGWHLIQVTERRSEDFSNNIKQKQAENILRNRKYEEELQVWLQEIRDEAFVEIKLANN